MTLEQRQGRNPHRLTKAQHRIPVRSIERFVGPLGKVDVYFENKQLALKPRDKFFAAKRAWDQRAESGYMKSAEDEYQEVANRVVADPETTLSESDHNKITRYFWLWFYRSRLDPSALKDVPLKGVTGGSYTKDEEEQLEKAFVSYVKSDGTIPARNMVGLRIQMEIDAGCIRYRGKKWGVVIPQEGEFIHVDVPNHDVIAVTPKLALVLNSQSALITRENLITLNRKLIKSACRFIFARSLDEALDGVASI